MSLLAFGRRNYTFADYVTLEASSNVRHEYFAGEIYAMAGGSPEHAALAAAMTVWLGNALGSKACHVFNSDLRVQVEATRLTTYPDVTVVCGPVQRSAEDAHTVLNPTLIVEVLSPSTEDYDRGDKLVHYKRIPSLKACLLVAQERPHIELWERHEQGWLQRHGRPGSSLRVPHANTDLDVDELYSALPI